MQLLFRARKFFCDNSECSKKTFAEQPGAEIFRYQRLTRAAEVSLCRTGVGCTSRLASGLIRSQGIAASGSTVLRHIHKATMPLTGHYRNIGVDDWAYRKGADYGAVVVDLDASLPVAILESRKQESFCGWLKDHPEVECVSRDRASEFSSAVQKQAATCAKWRPLSSADECTSHVPKNIRLAIRQVVVGNKCGVEPGLRN